MSVADPTAAATPGGANQITDAQPDLTGLLARLAAPSTRPEAARGLAELAVARLRAEAEFMDRTTAGRTGLAGRPVPLAAAARSLLAARPVPDRAEFHRRVAAHTRDWVAAHLPPDPADPQVTAWHEFHLQAGGLPGVLRDAHDLMYYGGLAPAAAAALLGRREADITDAIAAVQQLLKPTFDLARGVTPAAGGRPGRRRRK